MNTCKKCGCDDAYPSLPPCPTPVDCPNPQPCAEFFDANCVVYTGEALMCGDDIIIPSGASVAEAFADLILYLQNNGALTCGTPTPPLCTSSAFTYIKNTVLAMVNLPSVTPYYAFQDFLTTGVLLSNGPTNICCPTCGPYMLTSVTVFGKLYEAAGGVINCCNNIYASIETYNAYNLFTGGTLSPCNNGFTTAVNDLANLTGAPLQIAESGIVENGSLNVDGSTNIPDFIAMIEAFIIVDPTTTYLQITELLQRFGLVIECCENFIFIGGEESYALWQETGGCAPIL